MKKVDFSQSDDHGEANAPGIGRRAFVDLFLICVGFFFLCFDYWEQKGACLQVPTLVLVSSLVENKLLIQQQLASIRHTTARHIYACTSILLLAVPALKKTCFPCRRHLVAIHEVRDC